MLFLCEKILLFPTDIALYHLQHYDCEITTTIPSMLQYALLETRKYLTEVLLKLPTFTLMPSFFK